MKTYLWIIALGVLMMPFNAMAAEGQYDEFLNTRCDAMQQQTNNDKFKDMDAIDFTAEYLDFFALKYPQYDVEKHKKLFLDYTPKDDAPKALNPFIMLVMLSCAEEKFKDETLGVSIEKAMVWYFKNQEDNNKE